MNHIFGFLFASLKQPIPVDPASVLFEYKPFPPGDLVIPNVPLDIPSKPVSESNLSHVDTKHKLWLYLSKYQDTILLNNVWWTTYEVTPSVVHLVLRVSTAALPMQVPKYHWICHLWSSHFLTWTSLLTAVTQASLLRNCMQLQISPSPLCQWMHGPNLHLRYHRFFWH